MGKSLHDQFDEAKRVFEEADDALGFSISRLCFEGTAEDLKLTENTQPALLTVSTAAFRVLDSRGCKPDFVAGHSLGEWSAAVAAGGLAFRDAVRLVRKRGQYMQDAVPAGVGAMAAILKLPDGMLDGVLAEAAKGEVLSAANLNASDQVVIAGHAGAVARACELAKAAGARKAVPLQVSAPFHCALMKPAQDRMAEELAKVEVKDLTIPLVNNWQAREVRSADQVRAGLLAQIPNAVRWAESMALLAASGVTSAVEVGPGGVLAGLARGVRPEVRVVKFGQAIELDEVLSSLATA